MLKFLFGLAIGTFIGLVSAPASGEETRRQLADKAEQMRDRGIEAGRQKSREVGEKLFDKAVGED